MAQKIACPQCGETNYDTSPACWACGAALKGPRAATPPPSPGTAPGATPMEAEVKTLLEAAPEAAEAPAPPFAPVDSSTAAPEKSEAPAASISPAAAQMETLLEAVPDAVALPEGLPENSAGRAPKPAELEAAALREKEYVTPPVDVEESPKSFGEWIAYGVQALGASVSGFRESLDEYDRRRGRRSGTMSSYGCLVMAVTIAVCIALVVWMVSLFARPGG